LFFIQEKDKCHCTPTTAYCILDGAVDPQRVTPKVTLYRGINMTLKRHIQHATHMLIRILLINVSIYSKSNTGEIQVSPNSTTNSHTKRLSVDPDKRNYIVSYNVTLATYHLTGLVPLTD